MIFDPTFPPLLTPNDLHDTLQKHKYKMRQVGTINVLDHDDGNISGKEGISYVDIYPGD